MAKPNPLPSRPVERITGPVAHFIHIEAASGAVLAICTVTALVIANTGLGAGYTAFWNTRFTVGVGDATLSYPLWYWINDALMALFFFVIGLELKRELVLGELRDPRKMTLPIGAAIGGVLVPVGIFVAWSADRSGWAIPMATDIAFVIGALALLGKRIPHGLKVFMLSLAIVDDLLAVVVIAVAFTDQLALGWLAGAGAALAVVVAMDKVGVRSVASYVLVGSVVWLCTLKSGLHPTLAGVVLGILTPARRWLEADHLRQAIEHVPEQARWDEPEGRDALATLSVAATESVSPVARLERAMHPWVAYAIMPIFALANAAVAVSAAQLADAAAIGIAIALVVGKPVGILIGTWVAARVSGAALPERVSWPLLTGASCLGGVGFTMALFIASLALQGQALDAAKMGVLLGSAVSMGLGMAILVASAKKEPEAE